MVEKVGIEKIMKGWREEEGNNLKKNVKEENLMVMGNEG